MELIIFRILWYFCKLIAEIYFNRSSVPSFGALQIDHMSPTGGQSGQTCSRKGGKGERTGKRGERSKRNYKLKAR